MMEEPTAEVLEKADVEESLIPSEVDTEQKVKKPEKKKRRVKKIRIPRVQLIELYVMVLLLIGMVVFLMVKLHHYEKKYATLEQVDAKISENYYQDADEDDMMSGALAGYVAGLNDPYSEYFPPVDYTSFQQTESGSSVAIGVSVTTAEDGYLDIAGVTDDTPAKKAGLQEGDRILEVDGMDVAETGADDIINYIKTGEEGSTLQLKIQRDGEEMEIAVKREKVEVISASGCVLDGDVGYIRINAFRENTVEQFQAVYEDLTEQGVKGFIFDLRSDGGGLVDSLAEILNPLLPKGEAAICTYKDGSTDTIVNIDSDEELELPAVVLVNENTASAAELFTACLSDFGKAEVVGVTTYGKGVMQNTTALQNGGALKLTVATYQTTKGECYQGVGITPDYEVEVEEEDTIDYDNPNPDKDTQLAKAVEVLSSQE